MHSLRGGSSRPFNRKLGGIAFAALLTTLPRPVSAQTPPERAPKAFRVVFSSSTSCTDPNEFSARLREMTSLWQPASNGETAYTFFVHLSATQAGAHGQLGVLEPGGALMLRELETADCHTLLTALAFIGAVLADPFTSPPPASVPAHAATLRRRRVRARELVEVVKPWRFLLGPSFGIEGGVAPRVSPSVGLQLELAHVTGVPLDPSARVSVRVARAHASFAAGSAAFMLRSARLTLCPLRWQAFWGIDVRPCAAFEAGELAAQGFGTAQNKGSSLFWAAGGAEALVDVLHVGRLTLGLEGGVSFPLRRDRFYFDTNPGVDVHSVPVIAGNGAVSLSIRAF